MKKSKKILLAVLCSVIMIVGFSGCGELFQVHVHFYHTIITPATCIKEGITTLFCDCGDVLSEIKEPAKGHVWQTYIENEVIKEKCDVCGISKDIQSETHNYENGVCTNCGDIISLGLEYQLTQGGVAYSVVGIGTCTDSKIYIPEQYQGKPVISIGVEAFTGNDDIISVIIPNTVINIGDESFARCSNLREVVFGESVEHIAAESFSHCDLTSLKLPKSLKYIGEVAFKGNDNLREVVIPRGVVSMGINTFSCEYLTIYSETERKENGWASSWNSKNPVYYYSETQPTTNGNYWHYVNGVATKW